MRSSLEISQVYNLSDGALKCVGRIDDNNYIQDTSSVYILETDRKQCTANEICVHCKNCLESL